MKKLIGVKNKMFFFTALVALSAALLMSAFMPIVSLKGVWQYQGGIYNGKSEGAPTEYTLQRSYTSQGFTGYVLEKGVKAKKYEAGTYVLKADTCLETATFSSQPSQLIGKTVHYVYTIQKNMLTLSATLPSGMVVNEEWKKVK